MKKIVHLTDLHLRAPGGLVLRIDPVAPLAAVVRSINDNHADAVCCVVTGDIADAGEIEAYAIARDLLSSLKVPLHMTLGNHDRRHPFRTVFPDAAVSAGGYLQTAVDIGSHVLVIIDTLDEGHAGQGLVCTERLAWLDCELALHGDKPAMLFMHHPPLSIGLDWFDQMLIANGEELMSVIARHRNVVHLAFGHVHLNAHGNWRGLSFSGSRGTCHRILANPSATHADYVDPGPAYDLLLVGAKSIAVHSIDPAGPNRLIARELATPDQKGSFEMLRDRTVERWM